MIRTLEGRILNHRTVIRGEGLLSRSFCFSFSVDVRTETQLAHVKSFFGKGFCPLARFLLQSSFKIATLTDTFLGTCLNH